MGKKKGDGFGKSGKSLGEPQGAQAGGQMVGVEQLRLADFGLQSKLTKAHFAFFIPWDCSVSNLHY